MGTELSAGLTTFLTLSYILIVNPQILSAAGMPFDGVLFATCAASGAATLIMGLWARLPVALAPGMGLNAFFALVVVPMLVKAGHSPDRAWPTALGAVFLSGVIFLVLSLFRGRELLFGAIPATLKLAIGGGIGLFISLIGFENGALVRAHPATLVTLGDLHSAPALLTLLGLLVNAVLLARGVRGAVLFGMLAVTAVAILVGQATLPTSWVALPAPSSTFLKLDIAGAFRFGLLNAILAFTFVDIFDTVGTLIGVSRQGRLLDAEGKLPRLSQALLADAIGTILGALCGTSTITSYLESAAGIAAGGRTGLTAVTVAFLFFAALLFSPVFRAVPKSATAPVLILVGALMLSHLRHLEWDDLTEVIPAFLTITGIVFAFSIAEGLAFGFLSYALIKLFAGRAREVSGLCWVMAALFAARYLLVAR